MNASQPYNTKSIPDLRVPTDLTHKFNNGEAQRSSKKQVTWCPTEGITMQEQPKTIQDPYHEEVERNRIWYSPSELRSIQHSNKFLVYNCDTEGKQSINVQRRSGSYGCSNQMVLLGQEDCLRGLEAWTELGAWERFQHHRDCINIVLDEQEQQLQPRPGHGWVINHYCSSRSISLDPDRVQAKSCQVTARPKRIALVRGKQDFLEMKKTITPEDLLLQHQGRLASYLANRKQRVDSRKRAREMAQVEWEQRRKARRILLRKEADEHLEKMNNMIRSTNEQVGRINHSRM